jgi:hypothetical protein
MVLPKSSEVQDGAPK